MACSSSGSGSEVASPPYDQPGANVVFWGLVALWCKVPMRVIGMLLGIPEADQEEIRLAGDARLRREPGQPSHRAGRSLTDPTLYGGYLDWRTRNPSDDLMTGLLAVEFDDEAGAVRRLTRDEVLTFVNVLASAGNETTNRLIGWTGKVLADHPDQQRGVLTAEMLHDARIAARF
jgi:cytochrome P450